MPYQYPGNVPPQIKNKPAEQQKAFVEAFNASLARGQSEDSAFIAGLGAMNQVARKLSVKKQTFSAKEEKARPSHIPSPDVLKALKEEAARPLVEAEVKKIMLPSFLAKASLPQDMPRNLIAANFDRDGRLVLFFETGEKIVTDSIDIKQYIDNYVTIAGGGGGSSAPAGDLLYNEYPLTGTQVIVQAAQHMLSVITSYYILTQDGNEIILDVKIDQNKNITVSSLIPMTNFKLYLTGIKA